MQIHELAPITDIWIMLNANLTKANLTIDEQLFPYKGRTKLTQYIPSKPAKYGIKIWWLSDSENYYPLSGQKIWLVRVKGRADCSLSKISVILEIDNCRDDKEKQLVYS
ncbi:hypothetical protein WH47_09551 [Habropoda laboriosa]|uniref:PiggyBac transposable element-derived protein domain-containing protein n=1 Tax=Habropoda laboriosa TaxID=597456 RepID=A0A0L7RDV2_9HYME|nr:hypothetical protein WH47_09551 [Habropoda laboriosa]